MIVIGLTGGIGSGKTTVGRMFQDLGVPVYNSDVRAKELMNSSKKIQKELIALFGEKVFKDKELNRAFIAEKVFKDKNLLEQLNAIVHPKVRKDFLKWSKDQTFAYVIQETALLFENNSQKLYDEVILVTAPKELRIERVLQRDQITRKEILSRMNNQLEDKVKVKLADYIIENIDLDQTRQNVLDLHKRILAKYC
ncbi:dephospho-CoA kinase [Maribacter sp. MAR_2009_72]|uniref:dephospho-CoA kinase n=1 Tax=Maribacter sp. MAR_2009_72 TaxID=1250050 RepID=UPI001198DF8B|nr:dephospho-CoA kinase [Maribacter sp. MAR_2009_72]TVZ14449.1 dephospho-CoA kinase [Maribacter sp. MAR_2009_72]